ncbi:rapamycin-insensitive companion of mTOR-like [Styela clava]
MSGSRYRSFQSRNGTRRIRENAGDTIPLDITQDPYLLLMTIFRSIQSRGSTAKTLPHLNNLIKILCNREDATSKFLIEDIMICLKPALVSEVKEVRAACIRALRYLVNDAHSVILLTKLHLDSFIIKCLDISHFNEVERIQCLRLIRKILLIARIERREAGEKTKMSIIPKSFALCIMSISADGAVERDRVYRTCLAILCELVVLEPSLVIENGGLLVMLRAVLECHMYRRINESLCISLGLMLNHPSSRNLLKLTFSFNAIFAPYTDVMYRLHADVEESQIREEKEMRFSASKMAVVSVLRSWSGLLHLCQTSAIKSFLSTLLIPDAGIKRATLSVLFEIFCLNEPKASEDFIESLLSIGPRIFQESWQLTNIFVVGEGKWFLPSLNNERLDLTNCYMAVLLSIFIEANIIQRLVSVVMGPDECASIIACILLGKILNLSDKLHSMPQTAELWMTSASSACKECLPDLMKQATSQSVSKEERLRASVAVGRLRKIHNFLKNRPAMHTVYLDELLLRVKAAEKASTEATQVESPVRPGSSISLRRLTVNHVEDSDEPMTTLSIRRNRSLTIVRNFASEQTSTRIKDTQVIAERDFTKWDWEAITSFLVEGWSKRMVNTRESHYIGSDDTEYHFIKRLVTFYIPSDGEFYKVDRAREGEGDKPHVQSGCHLVRYLSTTAGEGMKLLSVLLKSIVEYLAKLIKDTDGMKKATSTFLSSCARDYFLLLGALTVWRHGSEILRKNGVFDFFTSLANDEIHENLLKLVISSLSFSGESLSYFFLKQVLVTCNEAARLYATCYLRILLRAKMPGFINWGVHLLITQLYDSSQTVATEALDVLDEACADHEYLNVVVGLRPGLLHLGEKGALLICRFASHPLGFEYLSANKYLLRELDRWWDSANDLYVSRVEELLNISLTCYEKPTQQGGFVRRSGIKKVVQPVHVPSHLYGELSQHERGCELLEKRNIVPRLVQKLQDGLHIHEAFCGDVDNFEFNLSSYQKIAEHLVQIKSSLWALCHIGSSRIGLELIKDLGVLEVLQDLAEHSPVYSIRGTCFYCMSVLSQTVAGTEELKKLGWLSTLKKVWSGSNPSESEIELETMMKSLSPFKITSSISERLNSSAGSESSRSALSSMDGTSSGNSAGKIIKDEDRLSKTSVSERSTKKSADFLSAKSPQIHSSPKTCSKCLNTVNKSILSCSFESIFCQFCGSNNDFKSHVQIDIAESIQPKMGKVLSNSSPALPDLDFMDERVYIEKPAIIVDYVNGRKNLPDEPWCFNKIENVSAMKYVVEQLNRYKESRVLFRSESVGDRAMVPISESVRQTIEESMTFVGIAVPKDFSQFFESKSSQSGAGGPVLPVVHRFKEKHYYSKQTKYFTDSSLDDSRSPASVKSTTAAFLDDVILSDGNHKETIHREILKLVASLGSSVGNKMNETALLVMKEKFPKMFDSTSLFYAISAILSQYNFRLTARRFIQELFHEVTFVEVFEEAKSVLHKYEQNV